MYIIRLLIKKHKIITEITDGGIVAVIRASSADVALHIINACMDGGLHAVEITFTIDGAHRIIEKIYARFAHKCILGAGTVLDSETARIAILSGASYIVSPSFDKKTALLCNRYSIPYMAGCYTPKEAVQAMEYGVEIIKLFPAGLMGPSAIKAFKTSLPHINIMPTGGVHLNNIKDWICAGAIALGIGGDLIAGADKGNFASITEKVITYMNAIKEARK